MTTSTAATLSPPRPAARLFAPGLVQPAVHDAFRKLDPRLQWRNPVMFVVYVGALLISV